MKPLLIVGLGDVARRALPLLRMHFDVSALMRASSMSIAGNAPTGIRTICGNLDHPETLQGHAGHATHLLYTAPPPNIGSTDPRIHALLEAIESSPAVIERFVYISTSGVYGDCGGAIVDETRPVHPHSDRARRRVDAETQLIAFGRRQGCRIVILRAPGIYAHDRLPLRRLHNRTPVLREQDDVFTNHIHADDLAAMCAAALTHPRAEGVYNACDDRALRMGEWFDLLADRAGLERPPRIAREEASAAIPAPLLSFMGESRRLLNTKIKQELGFALRYPTVYDGVPAVGDDSRA